MALYVNTNASSLNAQRMMANSTNALDTSYKRLASGLRINSAKDDAAGLQISDRLTSQINGLNQGNRNAQDGISYAQTAEGAMDEMTNMYQRIRTLALQSANGTNSSADRTALQQEVESLCSEIERISADTTWGGQKILDGSTASVDFQVGADAGQKITLSFAATAKKASDGSAAALAGNWGVDALIGAIGVKETDADKKGFKSITASIDGADKSIKVFDISNADKAQDVLASIDNYIAAVDAKRADFGALQNRLESTIRNQSNVSENVSAARSRIRDTDFASETAAMTQQNIIQQASQSILSQANQRPQVALSLLG
ncbi:flagellin [Succinimonas sp.]|jgi:flagellin|uniref:flagellin N-terminal helical domain-containing protein n=2 Tax=Succinimonas sp. TaxID=1936151 RepID=UPI002E8391F0|nr:flagellin [Succinimonas sp.]MEE3421794.1 flagellin [Succinimonas sp.]